MNDSAWERKYLEKYNRNVVFKRDINQLWRGYFEIMFTNVISSKIEIVQSCQLVINKIPTSII